MEEESKRMMKGIELVVPHKIPNKAFELMNGIREFKALYTNEDVLKYKCKSKKGSDEIDRLFEEYEEQICIEFDDLIKTSPVPRVKKKAEEETWLEYQNRVRKLIEETVGETPQAELLLPDPGVKEQRLYLMDNPLVQMSYEKYRNFSDYIAPDFVVKCKDYNVVIDAKNIKKITMPELKKLKRDQMGTGSLHSILIIDQKCSIKPKPLDFIRENYISVIFSKSAGHVKKRLKLIFNKLITLRFSTDIFCDEEGYPIASPIYDTLFEVAFRTSYVDRKKIPAIRGKSHLFKKSKYKVKVSDDNQCQFDISHEQATIIRNIMTRLPIVDFD